MKVAQKEEEEKKRDEILEAKQVTAFEVQVDINLSAVIQVS